jgi:OmcA/MtrC family decaheme c-type cytochrome
MPQRDRLTQEAGVSTHESSSVQTRRSLARPLRTVAVALTACAAGAALWTIPSHAAVMTAFQYNIISIQSSIGGSTVAPGQFALVTFSVTNPQTGTLYDLRSAPEWTQTASGASRLFLQIAWNTRDFTNTDSGSNGVGARGAALPIPINALGANVTVNADGTYTVLSPLPVPATASGTGEVFMEGHPAGQDATGAWTVRVPVKSAYRYFTIDDASIVPRRQIVDVAKCMVCHRSDGTGVAPRLTLHGNNRTEEPQVCVACHNPNNTDIAFRLATDPKVQIGSFTYPEQSLDFKRLVHGIHASSAGFRTNPLVVIGFNHSVFDASKLVRYPGRLRNCVTCHIDNGRTGTFELPLGSNVIGSSFDTKSFAANGAVTIDTNPGNDVKISPTAAVCSSCHDDRETISHMIRTGGASFNTDLGSLQSGAVQERCVNCHGPRREESVRKAHLDD